LKGEEFINGIDNDQPDTSGNAFLQELVALAGTVDDDLFITVSQAKGELKLNRDILLAGALLHDVGKLLEVSETAGTFKKTKEGSLVRHPFSGVALADENGLPAEVLHIIATHSKEGDPYKRTAEAIILHYADFMNFDPLEG
jgi:putative nucleotidyltransferase with HDIG domain